MVRACRDRTIQAQIEQFGRIFAQVALNALSASLALGGKAAINYKAMPDNIGRKRRTQPNNRVGNLLR